MNIALASLILLLLLLPGAAFRSFVIKSDSLENPLDSTLQTELTIVLVVSIFAHFVGVYAIEFFSYSLGYPLQVNFAQFFWIIKGDSKHVDSLFLNRNVIPFLSYTMTNIILFGLLGLWVKRLALKRYWDLKYSFISITNEWDQLLSGRLFEYDRLLEIEKRIKGLRLDKKNVREGESKEEILAALDEVIDELKAEKKKQLQYNFADIDALVSSSDGDLIYKGRVHKYYLSKDNSLDKIILKNAFRRKYYDNSETEKDEFKEFESKLFVLKYEQIKNLNVRFTFINEDVD